MAGDEVYGGRQLRRGIRQRGNGAAIWCGHGIFAHNLVKISTLAGRPTRPPHLGAALSAELAVKLRAAETRLSQ